MNAGKQRCGADRPATTAVSVLLSAAPCVGTAERPASGLARLSPQSPCSSLVDRSPYRTDATWFDQAMAQKLVIGCITGNLTIAEFRNRCRRPPLAGRVVRCVGGTLPQIKFIQKPTMNHLAKFQNCVVKTIYPHSNLFR
ncbi:uncharacterized protein LOC119440246 isoform X1 [Dermacentor silvarum]|uniref:uncharacterized protein LOC119440246 isoform X1 n=1 Tax=Dermacentor silvarum TaxID=543639 RepID=UPI0021012C79|nr:uncharacterized protein LOC119440246 isoform X1 [Dermacentor silvarum]